MLNLENVDTIVYPQDLNIDNPENIEPTFVTTVASSGGDHILTPEFAQVDGRFGVYKFRIIKGLDLEKFVLIQFLPNKFESHSNFASFLATACVYKGKWMYEVVLDTEGIQQIGWANIDTPFTNTEGVGDSANSYAYDGKRIKSWSVKDANYGQQWKIGDVIGCALDLETKTMTFYRNGHSLGAAYTNFKIGDGLALFPAASLSLAERVHTNFGARPFEFPVEGYLPLQSPPAKRYITLANSLVQSLSRLIILKSTPNAEIPIAEDDYYIIAAIIFSKLGPLLRDSYIVGSCLYQEVVRLSSSGKKNLTEFFRLLMTMLEEHEVKDFIHHFFHFLGIKCKVNGFLDNIRDLRAQKDEFFVPLHLLSDLLSIDFVRLAVVNSDEFPFVMDSIFCFKQPNNSELIQVLPQVWWNSPDIDISVKEKMDDDIGDINTLIQVREALVGSVLTLLLEDVQKIHFSDNPVIEKIFGQKSSQTAVTEWILQICQNVQSMHKANNHNVSFLPTVAIFTHLMKYLHQKTSTSTTSNTITPYLSSTESIFNPPYPPTSDYWNLNRLGGLLNHLQKTFPITKTTTTTNIPFEVCLMDACVIFYYYSVSSCFKTAFEHLENQTKTLAQLQDTLGVFKQLEKSDSKMSQSLKTLRDRVSVDVRNCVWDKCSILSQERLDLCWNFTDMTTDILESVSVTTPDLFGYIPEFYLEAVVDGFHSLRRLSIGTPTFDMFSDGRKPQLIKILNFLSGHLSDKRIVSPDMKDMLIQSTSVILQYEEFVKTMENPKMNKEILIKNLLNSFDQNMWIPVTNIILRFWRGKGFCQSLMTSTKKTTETASDILQSTFRGLMEKEPTLMAEFLNKAFNHLNWSVTEFCVSGKDIVSAKKTNTNDFQQLLRRCSIVFELSVSLLRVLEYMVLESPSFFLTQNINLTRVTELLIFILNRTTIGPDAKFFDPLLKTKHLGSKISKSALLAPVCGIIQTLSNAEINQDQKNLVKTFVKLGGFNLDSFNFLLEFPWKQEVPTEDPEILSKDLQQFKTFVGILNEEIEKNKTKDEDSTLKRTSSEDFCAICYSEAIDTTFKPCGHRSCAQCIKRHLLNNQNCFFCNAKITDIIADKTK